MKMFRCICGNSEFTEEELFRHWKEQHCEEIEIK